MPRRKKTKKVKVRIPVPNRPSKTIMPKTVYSRVRDKKVINDE